VHAVTDAEGYYEIDFTKSNFEVSGVESVANRMYSSVRYDGDELPGESPAKRDSEKRSPSVYEWIASKPIQTNNLLSMYRA